MVTMNDPYAVVVIPTKLCSGELLSRTERWLSRGKITLLPRGKGGDLDFRMAHQQPA